MLKEKSPCAVCDKRADCLNKLMTRLMAEPGKMALAIFEHYEMAGCQSGLLPFLTERIDERLLIAETEERAALVRGTGFATRLNALDTLVKEADEAGELTEVKEKIAAELLTKLLEEYRETGVDVLSLFYFQKKIILGDLILPWIERRAVADAGQDEEAYYSELWRVAQVRKSGRELDEKIGALAQEKDFWDSDANVRQEAAALVMNHLRIAASMPATACRFVHSIISLYPGLNKELYAALTEAAKDDKRFSAIIRYYDRKRERDMTRCELNGIIALHGQFQHCLPWEKERALELVMKLFALCDDEKHALGYLQRIQLSLPEFFGEVCARVAAKREESALFAELAKAAESLADMHAKMLAKKRALIEFFEKHAHYTDEELRQLVESDVDIGASATVTLFVWGRNEDYAKALSWLQEKGKTNGAFVKAYADISRAHAFLEELRDHLRRVYADVFGEEKAVEAEDDVFGKPKGKYVN